MFCYLLVLSLRLFKVKAKKYFTLCLADQLLRTVVFFCLCLKQKTKRPGKIWCVQCIGSILMSQCFRVSCHICYMSLSHICTGSLWAERENHEIQLSLLILAMGWPKMLIRKNSATNGKFRMSYNPIHLDLCCARISVYTNENNLQSYSPKYGKCWT